MYAYKNITLIPTLIVMSIMLVNANDTVLVGKPQSIKIINDTEQPLHVTHDIPEYTQASVKLNRLPEPQKMLYDAILNNSTKDILQAVKVGANVNLDIDGKLPILIAMSLKKLNAIEVLKKCGAIVPVLKSMMYRAIINDSPEEIRYALHAGANINEGGLGVATTFARYNAIKTLLECGAIPSLDQVEKSMLLGDIKSALLLLKEMPINKDTLRELHSWKKDNKDLFEYAVTEIYPIAIKDTFLEFIQAIIDHGYDINSTCFQCHQVNNELTQHASAWVSSLRNPYFTVELFEILMKNGANPNQIIYQNNGIWTPLSLAIQENNIKAIKYLLEAGANINMQVTHSSNHPRNTIQHTPLSYAKTLKYPNSDNHEIITLLLKHGAR